jgi:hypothetical protein
MSRNTALFAIALMALIAPASAQTRDDNVPSGGLARNQAECIAQFQAADINGDGFLNEREMDQARSLMPTQLANEDSVARSEFLQACNAQAESSNRGG